MRCLLVVNTRVETCALLVGAPAAILFSLRLQCRSGGHEQATAFCVSLSSGARLPNSCVFCPVRISAFVRFRFHRNTAEAATHSALSASVAERRVHGHTHSGGRTPPRRCHRRRIWRHLCSETSRQTTRRRYHRRP